MQFPSQFDCSCLFTKKSKMVFSVFVVSHSILDQFHFQRRIWKAGNVLYAMVCSGFDCGGFVGEIFASENFCWFLAIFVVDSFHSFGRNFCVSCRNFPQLRGLFLHLIVVSSGYLVHVATLWLWSSVDRKFCFCFVSFCVVVFMALSRPISLLSAAFLQQMLKQLFPYVGKVLPS